jgi:hypothetical protein
MALFIAAAIELAAPSLPKAPRLEYAEIIARDATKAGLDPMDIVAIVGHESQFKKGALSKNHEDYGLGQLRARFLPACRFDKHPVKHPSRACRALQKKLLRDGSFNLHLTVRIAATWSEKCRTTSVKTETEAAAIWMAGYAGGKCGPKAPPSARRAVAEMLVLKSKLLAQLPSRPESTSAEPLN